MCSKNLRAFHNLSSWLIYHSNYEVHIESNRLFDRLAD